MQSSSELRRPPGARAALRFHTRLYCDLIFLGHSKDSSDASNAKDILEQRWYRPLACIGDLLSTHPIVLPARGEWASPFSRFEQPELSSRKSPEVGRHSYCVSLESRR